MLAYPELKPKHSVNSKLLYFTWESCQRMESKQKKKKKKILFGQPVSQIWAPRLCFFKNPAGFTHNFMVTTIWQFSLKLNPTGSLKMHIVHQQGAATDKHIENNENSKRTGMGNLKKKKKAQNQVKQVGKALPALNTSKLWVAMSKQLYYQGTK